MNKIVTLFIVALSISAFAQEPVYQFSFDDTDNVKFIGNRDITIYPVSERMKPMIESSLEKSIQAADHVSGLIIKTENSDMAIQDIFNQLSEKTGEKIGRVWNSVLSKAKPTQILMGGSKTSTWYLVISPSSDGNHVLTLSYLIENTK